MPFGFIALGLGALGLGAFFGINNLAGNIRKGAEKAGENVGGGARAAGEEVSKGIRDAGEKASIGILAAGREVSGSVRDAGKDAAVGIDRAGIHVGRGVTEAGKQVRNGLGELGVQLRQGVLDAADTISARFQIVAGTVATAADGAAGKAAAALVESSRELAGAVRWAASLACASAIVIACGPANVAKASVVLVTSVVPWLLYLLTGKEGKPIVGLPTVYFVTFVAPSISFRIVFWICEPDELGNPLSKPYLVLVLANFLTAAAALLVASIGNELFARNFPFLLFLTAAVSVHMLVSWELLRIASYLDSAEWRLNVAKAVLWLALPCFIGV
ncbi:hypothetical protein DFJ73DRAFT_899633 [Zopfochytrium polystomum]|nr:hypothetical protein DFJ73DRAFT_899633 [Zopfochytrium polystomum]